ncbi:TnsA-like heteromeric transposase endonuclease subunit [Agromyces mediolanus]|uniref:TnsA-like heteromeric transposase endonuclease subunit n=1 Tax=Agromyces mediolanus TaxID=41986 RepID=A0A918CA50_AGRME|nr:TnsA-like heteromeric transposase endonuclease subunit [Agromyces mediolanus]GGR13518.1 hypothetical protein GCM10010196_02560 [Agromyces mediolanus]GLJ72660.1 hypothetical protein GCM10017583_19160 [Agromyces mediolanus]
MSYKPTTRTRLPNVITPGVAGISWIDLSGRRHNHVISRETGAMAMSGAQQLRKSYNGPSSRAMQGLYWSAATGRHHWHESLLESRAMLYAEYRGMVADLLPQPLQLTFEDSTTHIPDILVTRPDGGRTLIDAKWPAALSGFAAVSDATAKAAATLGWDYEIYTGLPGAAETNLEWLSAFRRPDLTPPKEVRSTVFGIVGRGARLGDVLENAAPLSSPHVFRMLWDQDLQLDLSSPMSLETVVWTNPAMTNPAPLNPVHPSRGAR